MFNSPHKICLNKLKVKSYQTGTISRDIVTEGIAGGGLLYSELSLKMDVSKSV